MKKEITLGNLLTILIPVFVIILTWGNSVETRLTEYSIRIAQQERSSMENKKLLEKIVENQTTILIKLENKKDRKK